MTIASEVEEKLGYRSEYPRARMSSNRYSIHEGCFSLISFFRRGVLELSEEMRAERKE